MERERESSHFINMSYMYTILTILSPSFTFQFFPAFADHKLAPNDLSEWPTKELIWSRLVETKDDMGLADSSIPGVGFNLQKWVNQPV